MKAGGIDERRDGAGFASKVLRWSRLHPGLKAPGSVAGSRPEDGLVRFGKKILYTKAGSPVLLD
jgi:hypothetical protein